MTRYAIFFARAAPLPPAPPVYRSYSYGYTPCSDLSLSASRIRTCLSVCHVAWRTVSVQLVPLLLLL